MRLMLAAGACAALFSGPAAGVEKVAPNYLDGMWEGQLRDFGDKEAIWKVRLLIQEGKAEVQQEVDGKWMPIKPGMFQIEQKNFNAVISTIDGPPTDCWDETWVFTVALTNSNELKTLFSRMVSNIRCLTPAGKTFSRAASGELQRQSTDPVARP